MMRNFLLMIGLMLWSIGSSSATTHFEGVVSAGLENESYCNTTVQHLGLEAETASAIVLTIQNVDANSMIVRITSADDDPVDFLLIPGPASGAMISDEDFSVPGEISRTLTWADSPPTEVLLNVLWSKESTGGNWQLSPGDVTVNFNEQCDGSVTIGLPLGFEESADSYSFFPIGGADAAIEGNPDQSGVNESANVMRTLKADMSEVFAGVVVDLDTPINFDESSVLEIDTWSPDAGITVRLAIENSESGGQVPVDVVNTAAGAWETLSFDFDGLLADDFVYDRLVVIFDFGVAGDGTTYYFDNIANGEPNGGGDDPNVYCNETVQHLGIPAETASAIVLTIQNVDANSMLVTITSADDDPVDFLLIPGPASGAMIGDEDFSVPGEISRTLSWADTPPAEVMLNVLWSKESTGGNWQLSPEDVTVAFDQMCDGGNEGVSLPLDFELPAEEYTFDFFGGAASAIEANPDQSGVNESATVMRTIKTAGAEVFAGTWVDLDQSIDFSQTSIINVDTWVPVGGVTVRVALESAGGGNQIAVDVATTVSGAWETLSANFAGLIDPGVDYGRVVVIFDFGNPGDDATYYYDNVDIFIDMTPQVELPLDFELPVEEYDFLGFQGAASAIEANPDQSGVNMSATVMRTTKTEGAEFFAGTFVNLDQPIEFLENPAIEMDIWSPKLDIPVRLQVENADGSVVAFVDQNTTTTNAWETLTYDFTGSLPEGQTWVRVTVFFEFIEGLAGDGTTYYYDNVEVVEGVAPELSFCNTTVTHLGIPGETASAIKLTIDNVDANSMIVTISSFTNSPVDVLIVANGSGAMISEEDFSVPGEISRTLSWADPPEDVTLNVLWSKENFEGNWQLSPMDITVPFTISCDDVLDQVDLPVTFEDEGVDYSFGDFEGNASSVVVDPTDGDNMVAQTVRTTSAGVFAGTVIGADGFASTIPFAPPLDTKISVRIWSPVAGIPVRMKVENAFNPGVFVETEQVTSVAEDWETIEFDFGSQAPGSPGLNFSESYSKAILFFNFGAEGGVVGEQTFFWDDVQFVPGPDDVEQVDLPLTFEEDNVAYLLTDFEGTFSQVVEDPTNPSNTVAQTDRGNGSAIFAGTTIGGSAGFASEIPFEDGSTFMNVRVWSPEANIQVRLKVENQGNAGQSVETEATVTVAEGWQTLEFDFSNQVEGTPAINFDFVYSKATIFFNFGAEPGTAGDQTFYWDNMQFGPAPEPFTVYDVINNSPDHTTLAFALGEAELVDALNGSGPFTVFAPTNDAFDALPDGVLDDLLADPTGDLQEILLYHVLGQQLAAGNITSGPQTTLQGEDVDLDVVDPDIFVNEVLVGPADLFADNGVVHVIGAVLLPPSFTEGLEELSSNRSIKAWPNPATDVLNIEFLEGVPADAQLTIYDLSGRMIDQLNPQTQLNRIDLSSYDAGQYVLRIDTQNRGYYHKFIIAK